MARRTLACPHCGLTLTIDDGQGSTRITYDPNEWRRLCQFPQLDSPALCLLETGGRDGNGSGAGRRGNGDRTKRH